MFSRARMLICAALLIIADTASHADTRSTFDPVERASRHPITFDTPAIDFFEGGVLGNGGMGVIVCTRPDAVVLYFGHNDVWDIRLAEDNADKIGTFGEIFSRVDAIPDTLSSLTDVPWFAEYLKVMRENYAKPYPRPFPCGSIVLKFDRREAELLGHRVNIDTGLCEVNFLIDGEHKQLRIFADMTSDILWMSMVDGGGLTCPSPFNTVTLRPDPATPKELPAYDITAQTNKGMLAFRQILPYEEIKERGDWRPHTKDKAFRLALKTSAPFLNRVTAAERENMGLGIIPSVKSAGVAKGIIDSDAGFVMAVRLDCGAASDTPGAEADIYTPAESTYTQAVSQSSGIWRDYWLKSGVALDDPLLEGTWYRNIYFLRCALRPGATCPGLFANWSFRNIGTAWHGDYHMNYNTQQPFWALFASNHVDLNLPYVDMVEDYLLPVSKKWAREYYGLRGAFFPHSAYPVDMTIMPYPLPTWGWEVFETPWTVQSLWWHYLYTGDTAFLRERAHPAMKEAVLFLVDYIKRPDARGKRFGDDRYHIFPSVPPELYGLRPGFEKNYDTQADLTLTRFLFNAYRETCDILDIESKERELLYDIADILEHLPGYPVAESRFGEVFVSVPGEDPEVVYNCPASLMTVFPGEEHGLDSPEDEYERAVRTLRSQQNEGGNDLVFLNMQAARLGVLDIEKFKRQIAYCLLPNGTCTDMVLQTLGRYTDNTPFDFMADMGIWFENFALPAVIDECLVQGYNGCIRLFPNWPDGKTAEFRTLRTAGAFLVSARMESGNVMWVEITSERGGNLTVLSPWENGIRMVDGDETRLIKGKEASIPTEPGQTIVLLPPR